MKYRFRVLTSSKNCSILKVVCDIFLLFCFLSLKERTFQIFISVQKLFSFPQYSNFRILEC